ncbi:glucose-1-phosphate cytidylyltransferase [Ramlibacter humi]|uniref:Glucose-1-phosphate cytidylyltransferase n=1 Tax=Ramlibacter humi TaxID=2530451 RepID=A0A4Z0CAM6_9BURK|nr:glucose-1-phosphate cytidylyltransferase [Ramlibacter humi]TFZ08064.1 glucose-1-phosphate cytidylyltransferase [Ramlibacter humi]
MKVVLFCGGLGMRIRDAENLPKPLVHIGHRPLLWHVMKYYAHYGHKDFILCLGYRAEAIKDYFLRYNECVSNDFVLSGGGKTLELMSRDIEDWRITFVDTGVSSNIGQRLRAVQKYLEGEEVFLANYSDGLTDLPLPQQLQHFERHQAVASFMCVRPNLSYHVVALRPGSELVADIHPIANGDMRINGGYFIFRKQIFEYMREGEELVEQPFLRLARDKLLLAHCYDGFWASMDTLKDKQHLESLYTAGAAAWQPWKVQPAASAAPVLTPVAADAAAQVH